MNNPGQPAPGKPPGMRGRALLSTSGDLQCLGRARPRRPARPRPASALWPLRSPWHRSSGCRRPGPREGHPNHIPYGPERRRGRWRISPAVSTSLVATCYENGLSSPAPRALASAGPEPRPGSPRCSCLGPAVASRTWGRARPDPGGTRPRLYPGGGITTGPSPRKARPRRGASSSTRPPPARFHTAPTRPPSRTSAAPRRTSRTTGAPAGRVTPGRRNADNTSNPQAPASRDTDCKAANRPRRRTARRRNSHSEVETGGPSRHRASALPNAISDSPPRTSNPFGRSWSP